MLQFIFLSQRPAVQHQCQIQAFSSIMSMENKILPCKFASINSHKENLFYLPPSMARCLAFFNQASHLTVFKATLGWKEKNITSLLHNNMAGGTGEKN